MRIALLVLLALTAEAAACPPGRPCLKYRHLTAPPAVTYRRAGRVAPPAGFDRRALAAFLDGSTWSPVDTTAAAIRFTLRPDRTLTGERVVLVRRLEQRGPTAYVEIDGDFYALAACAGTSCLTRAVLPPEPQHRFATPP